MTRETMGDIDHTHPHTGRAFGENGGVFVRGPAVADGGTDEGEMRDVEHTAPEGDDVNGVWERGVETAGDAEADPGTERRMPDEDVPEREEPVHE